jgi:uncharacterized membrane protein AbrB (regulator of aidB expression)
MATKPPGQGSGGTSVLMLLILLVVIGGIAFWAWRESPADTPTPSGTAAPATVPGGAAPAR